MLASKVIHDIYRDTCAAALARRNRALVALDYTSLHTGEPLGFSWSNCSCCGGNAGGDRYELYGLKPSTVAAGMTSERLGSCCAECFDIINGEAPVTGRVVIEVSGGVAHIASAPDDIEVIINDYEDQESEEGYQAERIEL